MVLPKSLQKQKQRQRVADRITKNLSNSKRCRIGISSLRNRCDTFTPREEALTNVFQFWAEPEFEEADMYERNRVFQVVEEMQRVRADSCKDMTNHLNALDPELFSVCSACGKEFRRDALHYPRPKTTTQFMDVLQNMMYTIGPIEHIPGINERCVSKRSQFCSQCTLALKKRRLPVGALARGSVFLDPIPTALLSLSKHEVLLISLRLPCIYSWRIQGGFGQYVSKGAPVSFSNPVAELANKLPRRPSVTFSILLESGSTVKVSTDRIRAALKWLISNNILYRDVKVDETAFEDIEKVTDESVFSSTEGISKESVLQRNTMDTTKCDDYDEVLHKEESVRRYKEMGSQGPVSTEDVFHLEKETTLGTEDLDSYEHAKYLIQHMLRPFSHRRKHIIPSSDAEAHLESYFPKLFPFGRGGPASTNLRLSIWVKHALRVYNSRFATDLDFIFFVYAVLRRRRLTGLSTCASIKSSCRSALNDVRSLLSGTLDSETISKRIDALIRSGTLSASFETLPGSPSFWASLKQTSWAYLTYFGPCQLFITMSAADLIDPHVFMQIKKDMTLEEARKLGSQERANLLANNPVAATTVFHRRVQSIFDNFLFGHTAPFCNIRAYLGRIEQQARQSPHLHLLLWLEKRGPETIDSTSESARNVAHFIELFCKATLPEETPISQGDLAHPAQPFPLPRVSQFSNPGSAPGYCPAPSISGNERQEVLSAPFDIQAFSGNPESYKLLRNQMIATQKHVCNSYCQNADRSCRFFFPFRIQQRASIALRSSDASDGSKIALSPRNCSDINSTHPLLTAMCRANTDVTVITGNSIAESMYVCNYTSKADKHVLFDKRALTKLRTLKDGVEENGRLLGAIARNSSAVRTIGGQEAVDMLVGNPLTFLSADVRCISVWFLITHPGSLTTEQEKELLLKMKSSESPKDLLQELDKDDNACVPSPITNSSYSNYQHVNEKFQGNTFIDPVLKDYMNRPHVLEDLSASEFYQEYAVKKLRNNSVSHDADLLLLKGEDSDIQKVAVKRAVQNRRPSIRNILNASKRSIADETDPYFAAAALCLHVPFRSVEDLLQGKVLTERLSDLLSTEDTNNSFIQRLKNYVQRSLELSEGICQSFRNARDRSNTAEQENSSHEEEDQYHSNWDIESNDLDDIDEAGCDERSTELNLPPFFSNQPALDPLQIKMKWQRSDHHSASAEFQFNRFRKYVQDCKTMGVRAANHHLSIRTDHEDDLRSPEDFDDETERIPSSIRILECKQNLLDKCKTEEQKLWLQSSVSYLQVFYEEDTSLVPEKLKAICKKNPPLFTNAPGGCGKSWLISQLQSFVIDCLPEIARYKWNMEPNGNGAFGNAKEDDLNISRSNNGRSRFGKFLIMAPTGVAASNCDGFTFHNALRSPIITIKELSKDIPPATVSKLCDDFFNVACIVIDEYSMASLVLLAYLDKTLRTIRPSCSDVYFGGIPVLLSRDCLQLPVVGGLGLLTNSNIPALLEGIYSHCTKGVLFLSLSQSIRQSGDREYADILSRLRVCTSTQADVEKLNERLFCTSESLCNESNEWRSAPVLTSRNRTAHRYNSSCISSNGGARGTFIIHSIPRISKLHSKEKVRSLCSKYYQNTCAPRFTARH